MGVAKTEVGAAMADLCETVSSGTRTLYERIAELDQLTLQTARMCLEIAELIAADRRRTEVERLERETEALEAKLRQRWVWRMLGATP